MNKPKIYYGYWVLLSASLFVLVTAGAGASTFGLFVRVLQDDLSWTRTEITAAFAFLLLSSGLASPLAVLPEVLKTADIRVPVLVTQGLDEDYGSF